MKSYSMIEQTRAADFHVRMLFARADLGRGFHVRMFFFAPQGEKEHIIN